MSIDACLTFDVDAEAPILAEGGRYARNAGVMSHQAYGPLVGVPRILDLLREYSLPATFFVPGWTADRYPQTVETILAAGHEVGHHSYAHFSPVAQTEDEERADFERALATLRRLGAERRGLPLPELGAELAHAADRRRARARLRLVADGRRQAVPARHAERGRSSSCRCTGRSTTGSSTRTSRDPPFRLGDRVAGEGARPLDSASSTRCAATAASSCSPATRSSPAGRTASRCCAALIEHALAAGDVEFAYLPRRRAQSACDPTTDGAC